MQCLPNSLLARVTSLQLKRVTDIDNLHTNAIGWPGIGDHDGVLQSGHAGLQKMQLLA